MSKIETTHQQICKYSKQTVRPPDYNDDDEESSFIFYHKIDKHKDNLIAKKMDYKFDVIENFRDPLTR